MMYLHVFQAASSRDDPQTKRRRGKCEGKMIDLEQSIAHLGAH